MHSGGQRAGKRRRSVREVVPASVNDTPADVRDAWPPLLSTLSHELRGSLNAIRGWAAVAENGSLPSDRIPRAIRVIKRNADSLSALIDTLFDLSRNAAGSLVLNVELVDLNRIARLVAESNYPAAERHGVALRTRCARRTLVVQGDKIRLEQVVRNLIDNAIKFTPGGGRVTVHTEWRAPYAELVIRDTGSGISPALLPVIFDPFRQGKTRVEPTDLGIGLGLALTRELVRLHQGRIEARSAGEGRGSTFIVRLPLASFKSSR